MREAAVRSAFKLSWEDSARRILCHPTFDSLGDAA
jgi:hypothetical protein